MASKKRDSTPQRVVKISVGSQQWSLGDLFKADFANIHDPKASVKSIQETLILVLNVLRGMEDSNA